MRTPSPQKCRLDLAPPSADRFIVEVAPIDYGPVLLLMPFGFHLTMDTLPSGELQMVASDPPWLVSGFRFRARLGFVIPSTFLRPARHYPRVRIWHSSFERQRDFNPPEQRAAQHALRRCTTPRHRACGTYMLSLSPTGPPLFRHGRQQGLSVLAHGVSRRPWVL